MPLCQVLHALYGIDMPHITGLTTIVFFDTSCYESLLIYIKFLAEKTKKHDLV